MPYKLLTAFADLFDGKIFRHRVATQGDYVAIQFYEDLYQLYRSQRYVSRVNNGIAVVNVSNTRRGVVARRGDGSFGEILPHESPVSEPGFVVKRGPIATIEIGIEVKIISKAMIRQVGRNISDLKDQVQHFKRKGGKPITIGLVGINHAPFYVSYEGDKKWATTGKGKYKHPYQEAAETERRLLQEAAPHFDEFLILHFVATNDPPYAFQWINQAATQAATVQFLFALAAAISHVALAHVGSPMPDLTRAGGCAAIIAIHVLPAARVRRGCPGPSGLARGQAEPGYDEVTERAPSPAAR